MKKRKKGKAIAIAVVALVVIAAIVVAGILVTQNMRRNQKLAEQISLGEQYLADLDYDQAIVAFQEAIEISEHDVAANLGLAEAYEGNEMYAYAEDVYEDMLDYNDEETEAYERLAELYLLQGKLEEAKALLEEAYSKTESETITQLYYVTRPEAPTSNYDAGEYQDRIQVTLSAADSTETIYYTTDGTEPTEDSDIYEEALILRNGVTTVKAMVINTTGYQSDIAVYEYDVQVNDVEVVLEEPLIEEIIRDKLGLSYYEPIYNEDIEQITELYIVGTAVGTGTDEDSVTMQETQYTVNGYTYDVWEYGQISTLNDLQYMPFLTTVAVEYQTDLDISILSQCDSITELSLVGDGLSDSEISVLSGLTNLEYLNLSWNNISSLEAVSGLTGLKSLGVWGNHLTDISEVAALTDLEYLDFSDNRVSDISALAGLVELRELWMYSNEISDISVLSNLVNLEVLMLKDNPIENPEAVRSIYAHLTRLDVDLLGLGGDEE